MKQPRVSVLAAGQPRYLRLAQSLIDDIGAWRYPVGELIPTEHELCAQFNVSRSTVREAIRRLSDLGLVTRHAGVGTRVRADRIGARYVQTSEGISDLFQYVRDVRMVVQGQSDITVGEGLADLLETKPGQVWVHLRAQRFLGKQTSSPAALTDIYVAQAYRAAVRDLSDPGIPVYALIEQEFGLAVAEVKQQVSATLITGDAADKLRVAPGSAGLRVVRKYLSSTGDIIEVAVNLHPGEQFIYSSRLRMEPFGTGPDND